MTDNNGENIYDMVARFRRQMLNRDRAASSEMIKAYGASWQRILARIEILESEYQKVKARGEEPGPSWIYEYNRLKELRGQVEAEIRDFARFAEARILEEQRFAVHEAESQAEALARRADVNSVIAGWNELPREALEQMVGFLQDGSPLKDLLDELPDEAGQVVADALTTGISMGKNPRAIARDIRADLGYNLTKALKISRTEVLRSYREATRQSYQANSEIVTGWIWISAHQDRTCAACWAMSGTRHTLDEIQDDHPNGRCTMIAIIPGMELEVEKGTDVFDALEDDRKLKILGPSKFIAYKNGDLTLPDLVQQSESRAWGTMRHEKSLVDAVGKEKAAEILQSKEYRDLVNQMAIDRLEQKKARGKKLTEKEERRYQRLTETKK